MRQDRGRRPGAGGAAMPGAGGEGISLARVTKRFGTTLAVDDVTLTIEAGEFFAVLGASGCGKSTLLRLVAGLETLDAGTIALAGEAVAGAGRHRPPEARGVAVVFQSYALWPHMSVAENVAFVAQSAGLARSEVREVTLRALEAVSLSALADRRPASLSGGQQQRVALARCLASRARTVLMDEPLANLDPHLRGAMEAELARVHAASGATTLYITHDQREAMALATRIAVMEAGRVLQVADPVALYERPASAAVARFIGRGALVPATVEAATGSQASVRLGGEAVTVAAPRGTRPGMATVLVRPEQVRFTPDGPFEARVAATAYRGGGYEVTLATDGLPAFEAMVPTPPDGSFVRFVVDGGWVLPTP